MRYTAPLSTALALCLALGACGREQGRRADATAESGEAPARESPVEATLIGHRIQTRLSGEEIERGRLDPSWRRVVHLDSSAPGDTTPYPEVWDDISAQTANAQATHLPLHDAMEGPSVLKAQVLLDRALFSPGIIDGRWGKNTEKALYWLQTREGLPATGRVDQATFERLAELAGAPGRIVREHRLTAEEVKGPFITIPDDIYEQAKLDCMCYESLSEKLGELFHTSPDLLRQLNPGVDLDAVSAGTTLQVPDVRDPAAPAGRASRLVISDGGFYLHGIDDQGRILYHFPTTLGSDYSPSPSGDFRVVNIAPNPTWHYQPKLLEGVPDEDEDAVIPPGPNSAVGVVWMELSKPHYGIHGTSAPETIGYTTSNGCVRLTNWDARFLSERIEPGIRVEFRDVDNPGASPR